MNGWSGVRAAMFGALAIISGLAATNWLIETIADGLPAWLIIGGGLTTISGLFLHATRPDPLMGDQTRATHLPASQSGPPSGGRRP